VNKIEKVGAPKQSNQRTAMMWTRDESISVDNKCVSQVGVPQAKPASSRTLKAPRRVPGGNARNYTLLGCLLTRRDGDATKLFDE